MSIRIQFVGAAQTVTGSRHLVHTSHGTLLLDCGLYQGRRVDARRRNLGLGFEPRAVDAVVLSHAHIDHSGALPVLCKQGFEGAIYSTPATRDLCALMLEDAAVIQAADARHVNRMIERGQLDSDPVEPLFDERDVATALGQFVSLPYHRTYQIARGVKLTFLDAGHVLGSAITLLDIEDDGRIERLVFTGDLGRPGMPILRDPELPDAATHLIMEGTYGDRVHPPLAGLDDQLAEIVNRTARRAGKVLIPSFALERAQQLIVSLKRLRSQHRIPALPVYVDSPLTTDITQVFRLHPDCYDAELASLLASGDSPFQFDGLRFVERVEDSRAIDALDEPCIIISASGMCEAGRILHHLKTHLGDRRHSVVIVGFMAQHTLGRRLTERRSSVRVFGVERRVEAEVAVLDGFSAHADSGDLVHFAEEVRARGRLEGVALVHGEPPALGALQDKLTTRGFTSVRVPTPGEIWHL